MPSRRSARLARLAHACASLVACIFVPAAALAADPAPSASSAPLPVPHVPDAVTHHTARIGGRDIRYTATAGTIVLENDKDEPTASVFYVAYAADGLGDRSRRPITFAYNGGPGGSSALIHMGALGPRMVVTTNGAVTPPPPYDLVDDDDSLLDKSDLVFVDAVGTGFSRIAGKGTPKDFYSVDGDGRAFEQFVRRYITTHDRWNSPKYLFGESYGTTRSAVLADMLQKDGIAVTGVVLMSNVLDFGTLIARSGNDEPYELFLPTESAVAAYHHRLASDPTDLPTFLRGVRTFALGPYAQALAKGAALPAAERDAIARELHDDTGLPLDYLVRSNLRVPPGRFEKQLLDGGGSTVGRYDGRFSAFSLDPIADEADTDPSSDAVFGAFTAAFNRYVREDLHYKTDAAYEFLSRDVNRQWGWGRGERTSSPVAVDVSDDLSEAMKTNPYLHVFSANGIYDLATPFFATEYSLGHLGLPPALQANISYGYYPAGHMIYLNPVAHHQLKRDVAKFYAR